MFSTFVTAFAVALDQLRVNTLRTILSTLGVTIGVGSLVAVLSFGDGMERFTRNQVERTTPVQTVSLASRTTVFVDGVWAPVTDYPVFGPDDAAAIRSDVEYVQEGVGTAASARAIAGRVSAGEWCPARGHRRARTIQG